MTPGRLSLRLEESGLGEAAREAHAAWVLDAVTVIRAAWAQVDGATASARLRTLSPEVVRALGWALGAGRLALAGDISHAVVRCLHWTPARELRDPTRARELGTAALAMSQDLDSAATAQMPLAVACPWRSPRCMPVTSPTRPAGSRPWPQIPPLPGRPTRRWR